jgi:hypothetical protein
MTEGGRVLTVNVVMPPANQPYPGKIIDMFLMVQLKGRERTEDEFFRDLYKREACRLETHEDCSRSLDALNCVSAPD